jgi:hypothetical protein
MLFVCPENELVLRLEQLNPACILTDKQQIAIWSEFHGSRDVLELEDLARWLDFDVCFGLIRLNKLIDVDANGHCTSQQTRCLLPVHKRSCLLMLAERKSPNSDASFVSFKQNVLKLLPVLAFALLLE